MTPRRRTLWIALGIVVALLCLVFVNLGRWLVIDMSLPAHIDVIFTFGGEVARDNYSEKLAKEHPESRWVVSTYRAAGRRRYLDGGIDSARVTFVDSCTSTWSEVHFLREWLAEQKPTPQRLNDLTTQQPNASTPQHLNSAPTSQQPCTIALVSGPYHMRRIKVAVTRLFGPDKEVHLVYAPVPYEWYPWDEKDYRRWWVRRDLRALVLQELRKCAFYLVRL